MQNDKEQAAAELIETMTNVNKLLNYSLNVQKTVCMLFQKINAPYNDPKVYVSGEIIQVFKKQEKCKNL